MKIQCRYCGNYIDDTHATCPHCGAPNEGVVRTASKQPMTIQQLADWYRDRGLPPYEVTRFFIGVDYRGPRAFGIYKDASGKCVVYKNKNDGSRAVRYEGTDEAYAVNELFMRLKQEILEQKARQVQKGKPISGAPHPASGSGAYPADYPKKGNTYSNYPQEVLSRASAQTPPPTKAYARQAYQPVKKKRGFFGSLIWFLYGKPLHMIGRFNPLGLLWLLFTGVLTAAIFLTPFLMIADPPSEGYYSYEKKTYYCIDQDGWLFRRDWIRYDKKAKTWSDTALSDTELPAELKKQKTASEYFLGEEWSKRFKATDALLSDYYIGLTHPKTVEKGYYMYDDIYYYHYGTEPDDGWYYYDDDSSDWYYVDEEILPEDLQKPTAERDFYYTPTWDSSTQFSDFLDSSAASSASATYSSSDSSSGSENDSSSWWDNDDDDDDYDWGSSYDDDDDWDWDWDDSSSDWDDDW